MLFSYYYFQKYDDTKMACDSSVPKEQCAALLKKYKLMKDMYNDADLKDMLNPDAYTQLHREMVEAGIKDASKSKEVGNLYFDW